tara:strand:- start:1411 stop:1854 length:444 start_codon:yes stop_codon:yes gene_type:complete
MSLQDAQTLLSDEQAITATAFSSNAYDTGNVVGGRNLGRTFADLRAVTTIDAAFNNLTSLTVEIGHADDAAGTGFVALASSGAVTLANLNAARKPFDIPMPDSTKRFIMARYTVAGTAPTTGKVTTSLQIGSDFQRAYPSGAQVPAY